MPRTLDDVCKTRTLPDDDAVGLPTPQADSLLLPVRPHDSPGPAAEPEPVEELLECPGYGHGV